MITKVTFMSRAEIEDIRGDIPETAVISMFDTEGTPKLQANFGMLLSMCVFDIDKEYQPELGYICFDVEHAENIICFLHLANKMPWIEHVIVQCHTGISRSAAVAKFIADMFHIENFNHNYTLYNKHIYRTLTNIYNHQSEE